MTNAEIAILSLVVEQPRHGYEIEQVIDERGMREWTEVGFSSIYFLLKKLEKAGLIQGHLEPAAGKGPARKVYHATPAGVEILHQSIEKALATTVQAGSHLQLALANLPMLTPDEVLEALIQRRKSLQDLRQSISQKWEDQRPLPYFVDAMFDNSLIMIQAELDWINKFIGRMEVEMPKLDVKKDRKELYNPSKKEFSIVDVPPMSFIMLDGHGNPNNNPVYEKTLEALYSLAYTFKFALKPQGIEFSVAPLEGLWWMPDMNEFSAANKDRWDWTMMIQQPEQVTDELFEKARAEVIHKKGLPLAEKVRLETYPEGQSVQILYLGAYADEGPTIARMHEFIHAHGYMPNGKHHEIYLGDPRRSAPAKLKTIIRQPIRKIE